MGGQLDRSIMKQINKLTKWETLSKFEDVSEFVHTMTKQIRLFRVIVIKRNITPMSKSWRCANRWREKLSTIKRDFM